MEEDMATKLKTLILTFPHVKPDTGERNYRVVSIVNSTEFETKSYLTKAQVDELCTAPGWTVTTNKSR